MQPGVRGRRRSLRAAPRDRCGNASSTGDEAQRVAAEPGRSKAWRCSHAPRARRRPRAPARRAEAVAPRRRPEPRRARDQQRDEIGHRGAGDEEAAGAVGKAEHLAHQRAIWRSTSIGDVVAPAEIGVHARGQHLGQHADGVPPPCTQPMKRGMRVAGWHRAGCAAEIRDGRRRAASAATGRAARKLRPHLVRQLAARPAARACRANDRAVVEHAMPERAPLVPILGIERRASYARPGRSCDGALLAAAPRAAFSIARRRRRASASAAPCRERSSADPWRGRSSRCRPRTAAGGRPAVCAQSMAK